MSFPEHVGVVPVRQKYNEPLTSENKSTENVVKGTGSTGNGRKCPGIKDNCCCKCENCNCIDEKGICDCCKCCERCDCTGAASIRRKSRQVKPESQGNSNVKEFSSTSCCKCVLAKESCNCCRCCEQCKCTDVVKDRVSEWCVVGVAET